MLSSFHLVPERNGQTDGQTDLLYQYRVLLHEHFSRKKYKTKPSVRIQLGYKLRQRSTWQTDAFLANRLSI